MSHAARSGGEKLASVAGARTDRRAQPSRRPCMFGTVATIRPRIGSHRAARRFPARGTPPRAIPFPRASERRLARVLGLGRSRSAEKGDPERLDETRGGQPARQREHADRDRDRDRHDEALDVEPAEQRLEHQPFTREAVERRQAEIAAEPSRKKPDVHGIRFASPPSSSMLRVCVA